MPTAIVERLTQLALPADVPGLPSAEQLQRWAQEFVSSAPGAGGVNAIAPPGIPPVQADLVRTAPVPGAAWVDQLALLADQALRPLQAADLAHPEVPAVPGHRVLQTSPVSSVPDTGLPAAAVGSSPHFYFLPVSVTPAVSATPRTFDVNAVRRDFPILQTRVHGRPLIWFDNAATTQKPRAVIERLDHFYRHENSNIHRAAHELAARATDAYEGARRQVQRFLNAAAPEEIVFVRGATEAINLVAQSWGRRFIDSGDEIVVSHLEHHANIVPWHALAAERGAVLKVAPVDDTGQIRLDELQRLVTSRTRLVAVTHVANALGTVTPVREVVDIGHRAGARVLIDGAQSVSHVPIDLQALGADFFVLSGHKVFGPTGIGVLYGRQEVLADMPPWQGGGNMIEDVTFESIRYQAPPARFEAGTGNIADAAGLGAALDYLSSLGMRAIEQYEHALLEYATQRLQHVPGLRIIGTATHKASVLSFVIDGLAPTEIGSALNQEGIAVRAGHHCAQPILRRFGHEATVRASLAFYNTCEEVDALSGVLRRLTAGRGPRTSTGLAR